MSNYPAGAECDKSAPYNQEDNEEIKQCNIDDALEEVQSDYCKEFEEMFIIGISDTDFLEKAKIFRKHVLDMAQEKANKRADEKGYQEDLFGDE
jgi:hypothetical protein